MGHDPEAARDNLRLSLIRLLFTRRSGSGNPLALGSAREDANMASIARQCRDWADEYWEAVGIALSFAGAVTVSLVLIVSFNVITTHLEDSHHDVPATDARPWTSADRPGPSSL